MLVKKLVLRNFRNFQDNTIYFHPFLTIIVGKNAVGKTNLLESLYLTTHGRGLSEKRQEELIRFDQNSFQVGAEYQDDQDKVFFSVSLVKDKNSTEKKYMINRVKKTLSQYAKQAPPVVVFTPAQISIIDGSPDSRRRFVDDILNRVDPTYHKNLIDYNSGLVKRNKVLEVEKDSRTLRDELDFWDTYLIERAQYLKAKRSELVAFINKSQQPEKNHTFSMKYLPNEMSKKTLEQTFDRQLAMQTTLVGPQRDDFQVNKDAKDVHLYGSRSEQRMALFWLILGQLALYKKRLKLAPILLLDDIFSELDYPHKELVLDLIQQYQTVLTTTEADLVESLAQPHSVVAL